MGQICLLWFALSNMELLLVRTDIAFNLLLPAVPVQDLKMSNPIIESVIEAPDFLQSHPGRIRG